MIKKIVPAGLEPATPALLALCSNRLSYRTYRSKRHELDDMEKKLVTDTDIDRTKNVWCDGMKKNLNLTFLSFK